MKAKIFFVLTSLFMPLLVWAQAVTIPTTTVSDSDAINQIIALIQSGQVKGLALAIVIIQVLMYILNSQTVSDMIAKANSGLGKFLYSNKMVIILTFSLLAVVIQAKVQGLSTTQVITNSVVLTALQAWGHQIYVQYIKKESTPTSQKESTPTSST